MRTKHMFLAVVLAGFAASLARADETGNATQPYSPYVGSPAFEFVKSLSGEWTGSVNEGASLTKKKDKHKKSDKSDSAAQAPAVGVTYRTTSNGHAVVETIFVGTPHEMTSVYYERNGKLAMTHYCAIGNRPTMDLDKETPTSVWLNYSGGEGLDPAKDMHIHSVSLTLNKDGTLTQTWVGYENGKPTKNTVLSLQRVH